MERAPADNRSKCCPGYEAGKLRLISRMSGWKTGRKYSGAPGIVDLLFK